MVQCSKNCNNDRNSNKGEKADEMLFVIGCFLALNDWFS